MHAYTLSRDVGKRKQASLLFLWGSCADPGGGESVTPPGGEGEGGVHTPPLKNHKNIGFHSNTGPDPMKSENHNVFKPALNVGPSSARQRIVSPVDR